jgi:RNA polymerase sigma-70 factor (ECF subfamily)
MPAGDRKVLELVAYAQLSPTEAALALGISPNAARLRLARARMRLRERLPSADASAGLAAPDTEVSSHDQ